MAVTFIPMKTAGIVPSGQSLRVSYVPATGEDCTLLEFSGHAGLSSDSLVCVCFDEGGDDVVLWSTTGDSTENGLSEGPVTGDGVKKFELILDNSTGDALTMTGKIKFKSELP